MTRVSQSLELVPKAKDPSPTRAQGLPVSKVSRIWLERNELGVILSGESLFPHSQVIVMISRAQSDLGAVGDR